MMRCFSEKRKEIVMSEKNYVQELVDIIRSGLPENELVDFYLEILLFSISGHSSQIINPY